MDDDGSSMIGPDDKSVRMDVHLTIINRIMEWGFNLTSAGEGIITDGSNMDIGWMFISIMG